MSKTLEALVSSTYKNPAYGFGFPPQTVSIAEKETDDWQRACMRFMVNEARAHNMSKVKDLKKFKMLSDQYDYADHRWAIDPLNLGDKKEELYGATDPIQHFPIINSPLNTILGERIGRPTQFYVVSYAPESRNEYMRQKQDMIYESVKQAALQPIYQQLFQNAQQQGIPIDQNFMQQVQQQAQQMLPHEIQDYLDKSFTDTIEQAHNRILKNFIRRENAEAQFIEGFRYGTIVGKEYYAYPVVNNRVKLKNLSPFSVFHHKSPSSQWVSESQFAGYRLLLTPSAVIDTYREYLDIDDIIKLEKVNNPSARGGGFNSLTGIKSISYDTSVFTDWQGGRFDLDNNLITSMIDEFMNTGRRTFNRGNYGLHEVIQAYWKSYRKVGFLEVFMGEQDNSVISLVDENYEPDEEQGENVEWFYLNQVYQGTAIGDEIIFNVKPYPFQIFDPSDPDYSPLPIEGSEYNNYNGEPMSLVDLMLPWAELYDIVANELKKDMKKAIGKVMFMSIDNIPNIPGFDMDKWYYWAKEFGIAWVANNNQRNQFSHYAAADMSFAQEIENKMRLLEQLKQNCDSFAGFSQPRLGDRSSDPTAQQGQQRLVASVNQTEYYFWKHSQIIQQVLTHCLNINKVLIKKDPHRELLFDDLEERYIDVDIDKITAANSGLYVINSTQELTKREALRQMAMSAAGKTGQAKDMGEIIMADTQNEIRLVLRRMDRKQNETQQQNYQLEQDKIKAEQDQANQDRAWEREKLYATLASREREAYMKTFGLQDNNLKDENGNGTPDVLDYYDFIEKQADNLRKDAIKREELSMKRDQSNKEISLKEKEIGIKRESLKVERENMKNDKEIAQINAKNRNKPSK